MPRGVQYQSSFLGGAWSVEAQGRLDHPWHAAALSLSYNGMPVEGGQWVRRPGTRWVAPVYQRPADSAIRTASFNSQHRHAVLFGLDGGGNSNMFLFRGKNVVTNSSATIDTSSSSAGVLTIVTHTSTGWNVNDLVIFTNLSSGSYGYLNRWLRISVIAGANITLTDDTGAVLPFDSTANALTGVTINRILRQTITNASTNVKAFSVVNFGNLSGVLSALVVHPLAKPQNVTITSESNTTLPDVFSITDAAFQDGPYLDQQGTFAIPETGTVSAYSGSITFTPQTTVFGAGDVGRHIRLFTQPAAWASGTTYNVGDTVTYNNAAWKCVYGGVSAVQPGTLYTLSGVQYTVWAPAPTEFSWAWGTITAQAGATCTVSLTTNLNSKNGTTVSIWRLGKYKTGQYPQCGILYEGRLYLGGALEGQFDGSTTTDVLTFSPTDPNGNVFDSHSLNIKIAAPTTDNVIWFRPDRAGLLFGTVAEEYVLNGGGPDAVITPTNFSLKRVSTYGSIPSPVRAVTGAFSHIFVQTYGTQVYEFVTDVFAASPSGRRLNPFQQDMMEVKGAATDLAYTENKVPAVWLSTNDGSLLSCTYRRFSRFMSSPPDMAGWAEHHIADGVVSAVSCTAMENYRDSSNSDYLYVTTTSTAVDMISKGVEMISLNMEGA